MIEQLLPFILPFENLSHLSITHSETHIRVESNDQLAMEVSKDNIGIKISTVHFDVGQPLTLGFTSFQDALMHVVMNLGGLIEKPRVVV